MKNALLLIVDKKIKKALVIQHIESITETNGVVTVRMTSGTEHELPESFENIVDIFCDTKQKPGVYN